MIKHTVTVILLISATSIAFAQSTSPELKARIDEVAQREIAAHNGVGLIIGVAHNGERSIFSYGETVKGNGRKPDDKTLFQIGSITKTFTAALLADFVHRGKARLDDPLGKYFPRAHIPSYGQRQITLLDLATHTSALPRNLGRWQRPQMTLQDMLTFLGSYRLPRAPGEHYLYSNLAFALLGHALARSENTNWAAITRREIISPLDLRDTVVEPAPEQQTRCAQGYGPAANPAPLHSNMWPAMAPAGGLYSTMDDMLSYLAYSMGERETPLNELLSILHQARHAGPKPGTQIALGWELRQTPNGNIIWKNGATPGFHSYIGFNPANKTGVVVLSNSTLTPAAFVSAIYSYFKIGSAESAPDAGENPEDADSGSDK